MTSGPFENREPRPGSASVVLPRPVDVERPAEFEHERPAVARAVLERAGDYLAGLQQSDGHWCAELEGDSILESEYLLTLCFLGRLDEPRAEKIANYLRARQSEDGGWDQYPGGRSDVSNTIKAYFALKLVGDAADAPHMERARERILELGGLDAANSFTKLYLAIFGQYPWVRCPAVPPEMLLFPHWFPFNIYEMSSWSRAIVVPLSIIWAIKPQFPVPAGADLSELRTRGHRSQNKSSSDLRTRGWELFFRAAERVFTVADQLRFRPLRRRALAAAARWTVQHLEASDGLGAIFPPIVNSIFALHCLGYSQDDPLVQAQVRELERFELEGSDPECGDTLRVQPCFSPVWDTALSINALLDSGYSANDDRLAHAAEWLLNHEVRSRGDWKIKNPAAEAGGWYFQYSNEFYPDCDDTAEVLAALSRLRPAAAPLRRRVEVARERGIRWLLEMQNSDGGWAAFDKDCDREFLVHVPFADHNAMIDPSTVDITARVLRALVLHGYSKNDPPVARGVAFIRSCQEEDGSWYGRWGCNYIYGTWLALTGLAAAEVDGDTSIGRAVDWLLAHQNADGGWGELPTSYAEPDTKGVGPSTAAQSAWAVLGLLAAGFGSRSDVDRETEDPTDGGGTAAEPPNVIAAGPVLERAAAFLARRQAEDGSWHDDHWTGTGFPKVFYLRYHLYATYFPLQALGALDARAERQSTPPQLKLV